jgi:hypothetical protein
MTSELVRAHWITSAPSFLAGHFAEDVGQRLRESLPVDARRALTELEPVQWCPREHHVELMKAIASVKKLDADVLQDLVGYGEYVARLRLEGTFRHLLPILTLKLFAKNLPALWARDHQDGSRLEVDLAPIDDGRLPFGILGAREYDHVGVVALGWVKHAVSELTKRPVQAKQRGWALRTPAPDEIQCEVSWS